MRCHVLSFAIAAVAAGSGSFDSFDLLPVVLPDPHQAVFKQPDLVVQRLIQGRQLFNFTVPWT